MPPTDPVDQQPSNTQRTVLLATDNQNSVLAEVAGNATHCLAYSAYGHQSARQAVATRLGFNGELREAHTCWYLLGNGYRAYNPRLMRFHSPDSWSPFGRGGLNPYMYCVGDPINRSDPTGHNSLLDFIFGVKRFLSGDPGFRVSGGGRKLGRAAGGLLVNMKTSKWTGTVSGHSSASNVQEVVSTPSPALTGPGALFADFSNAGGFRSSGASSSTQRVTRRNSLPTTDTPPPSYAEAMALSNADTFARSQQPQTYVVNSMHTPRTYDPGNSVPRVPTAQQRALEQHQAQMAAQHAAQQAQFQAALAALDNVQRDAAQLRQANRNCRIL